MEESQTEDLALIPTLQKAPWKIRKIKQGLWLTSLHSRRKSFKITDLKDLYPELKELLRHSKKNNPIFKNWAKDFSRHFTEENRWKTNNKHMQRYTIIH